MKIMQTNLRENIINLANPKISNENHENHENLIISHDIMKKHAIFKKYKRESIKL